MIAESKSAASSPVTPKSGSTSELSDSSRNEPWHQLPSELFYCTCREPTCVVLSDETDHQNKATFIQNLRTHGWSPISVPEAPWPSPSQEELLAIFRRRRQRQRPNTDDAKDSDVTFIAAESGSSEGTIEPKESLEVLLSKCGGLDVNTGNNAHTVKEGEDDHDEATVKAWCKTLSWIAHKICRVMLDLPENAFLPEDPKESLDLLRVFHYYAAEGSLGSSEHTDWGSLTVVWQDSVGGLQTYCRKRKQWINVRAAADDGTKGSSYRWECIVHVGDMSSLVLAQSSETKSISKDINATHDSSEMVSYPWPSPRHRVKSHPHKERVSLVYFGYPPRGLSLSEIQKRLDEDWSHSSTRGNPLPLGEYFLLRNQAVKEESTSNGAHGDDYDAEAGRLYQKMWNLPVQDIVRLKWEQVSR